ncbi:MAG: porin family protein [Rhizobiales bacterium]|nr:porin family protein [Hyphomicrobiales bacterium]
MTSRSDSAMTRRFHRAFVVAAVTIVAVASGTARAADFGDDDFLRGTLAPFSSSSYQDWSGVNFGVTISRSTQSADFGSGTSDLIAYILRNTVIENEGQVSQWTTAGKSTTTSNGYGVFLGYNYEIEPRLYVGIDATYNRFSSALTSGYSDTLARSFLTSTSYNYNVYLDTSSSVSLRDYGTVRARLGYSFGQFLPYAVLGGAVGRVDVTRQATVGTSALYVGGGGLPNIGYSQQTQSDNRSAIAYGIVAGAGLDAMILPNVFLRAEYEFVQFTPVNGIKMNLQTGRVGVGMKF